MHGNKNRSKNNNNDLMILHEVKKVDSVDK